MKKDQDIKRSYRFLLKKARAGMNEPELVWLCDNFYVFSKAFALSRGVKMPSCMGRIFEECDRRLCDIGEDDLIKICLSMGDECSAEFIYALPGALCGRAIVFAEWCINMHKEHLLSNAVKLIRMALNLSTDDIFSKAYPAEKILSDCCEGYPELDDASKNVCRRYVSRYAAKKRISECDAARELSGGRIYEGVNSFHLGIRRAVYFSLCIIITSIIIYAGYILCGIPAFFAFLPVYAGVCAVGDVFLSRLKKPFVFRVKMKKYPKTAVVITTLLFGPDKDREVFENLASFCLADGGEQNIFCLLADLCDSDTEVREEDGAIRENAISRIERLNAEYGHRFCLVLRRRTYNAADGIWQGRERKRGAICDLVRLIKGEAIDAEVYGCEISGTRYVCTLDRDTVIPMNGVTELLQAALCAGKRGFMLFQPSMHVTLEAAYATYFSRMISGEDCGDAYSAFSFDRSTSLFGSGSFCGKGLFDVDAFYDNVIPRIPDGRVLSHDIVEGELLRTLYVPDVQLFDGCPSSPNAYFKRLHRWIRGDVQNAIFLFGRALPISGRCKIFANILRVAERIFMLVSVVFAAFLKGEAALFMLCAALLPIILPPLLTLFITLSGRNVTVKRYFSEGISVVKRIFASLLWSLCSSAAEGFVCADASLRAVWRMIRGRKLLEWSTAFQSEGGQGHKLDLASLLFGLALAIVSRNILSVFLGLCFALYPIASRLVSRRIVSRAQVFGADEKAYLASEAGKIWRFFGENVGKNTFYLPPDNIQYSPVMRVAMRTSPTNIGFYLVSVIAAKDFGFISPDEALTRLSCTLQTLERLPKYRGMLYNWYDLTTLEPLGDFVSSVDQGNFLCCLTSCASALAELKKKRAEDIIKRIDRLRECEISVFLDEKMQLISLGMQGDRRININYDRLMSEFRLSAYYFVATSACEKKVWHRMSRSCGSKNGFVGMLSWAGTAFEYFMPQLFLPRVRNSFIDESLLYAYKLQTEARVGGMWGISESAYYSFDGDMNYAYRAHGVKGLAVKNYASDPNVFSPYSVYLTLCLGRHESIRTLKRYASIGMSGRYGLYEATSHLDGVFMNVRSYMAHHMGMSLIACANACFDDIFVKRFMSDRRMQSASGLLREGVPKEVRLYAPPHYAALRDAEYAPGDADITLISSGSASAVCEKDGRISLSWGGMQLCGGDPEGNVIGGLCVTFSDGNYSYGCAPGYGDGVYSHSFSRTEACFISASKAFTGMVKFCNSSSADGFLIGCSGDNRKDFSVTLAFTPIMCSRRDYDFHPAYSGLFITSEQEKSLNALLFNERRSGRWMCVSPLETNIKYEFSASKENLLSGSLCDVSDLEKINPENREGTCVFPFCLLRTRPIRGGRVTFVITCGESRDEALSNLVAIRRGKDIISKGGPVSDALSLMLASATAPKGIHQDERPPVSKAGSLWKHGISGDMPLITLIAREGAHRSLDAFLSGFSAMKGGFIACELAIVTPDTDTYNRPIENSVRILCERRGLSHLINARGGIFILREEPEYDVSALRIDLEKPFFDAASPENTPEKIIRSRHSAYDVRVDADSVTLTGNTKMPHSWCMGNKNGFGCVVTDLSAGYTFLGNCREKRICYFPHDPFSSSCGETAVYAGHDLCACAESVHYSAGKAEYRGSINGVGYVLTVFICGDADAKIFSVAFSSKPDKEVALCLKPCGQNGLSCRSIAQTLSGGVVFSQDMYDVSPLYAYAAGGECRIMRDKIKIISSGDSVFVLSAADSPETAAETGMRALMTASHQLESAIRFAKSFIPNEKKHFSDPDLQKMYSFYLPYQVGMCRFVCRGSFYQAGGAFGFRDQLQDCMALVYSVPHEVRKHILECCRHQYTEGDVMHWWHPGIGGVRTKCGDDRLFLPLAVGEYVRVTNDMSLLNESACFLSSPPLGNKNSRYEPENFTEHTGTVAEHCLLAFSSIRTGPHGLAEMGSCDWNDAFSDIGGESLLTTFLFVWAANEFGRICDLGEIKEKASALLASAEKLYADGRYARAIARDGTVYGREGIEECAIDCAVQALAAFAGAKHGKEAVNTAYDLLFDRENSLIRLLSPPFDKGKTPAGDIRNYPKGIRENGGQYTHAAVWLALAMLQVGEDKKAYELARALCPLGRNGDIYKVEPYVMSADIYSAENLIGRGGWSWYTGSAAWYYLLLKNLPEA